MSKALESCKKANKDVEAFVLSFILRYELALKQLHGGCKVEIKPEELQDDLKNLRSATARLLNEVARIESFIEDLVSHS
jgi:hypothetical protein